MAKALTTIEKLKGRVNALDGGNINAVLYDCLSSATTQLISAIKVKFLDAKVAQVEDFLVPDNHVIRNNRYITFRLNNGFINQSTNEITVKYGVTEDDLTTAVNIESKYLKIDDEKGLVTFDTYQLHDSLIGSRNGSGSFVNHIFRITYDYGFESSTTSDGVFYKAVPDWLVEAALIKGREIYQLTVPSESKKAEDGSINLSSLIDSYIRYNPSALKPII